MSSLYISSVFVAGLLSFFSPCILPVLPVYIGYFNEESDVSNVIKPLLKALAFVLGLSVSFVLLGFGAGLLGQVLYSRWFLILCGIVIIILGIYQLDVLHIPSLMKDRRIRYTPQKNSVIGSFLLGLVFSFGWTPCVGPILAAVLGITATQGEGLYGGLYMAVYSLGLAIPFMLLAIFRHLLLHKVKGIYPYMPWIKRAGGVLLILMGILVMTQKIQSITAWFS